MAIVGRSERRTHPRRGKLLPGYLKELAGAIEGGHVHNYVNRILIAGRQRALHHAAWCHGLVAHHGLALRGQRIRGLTLRLVATDRRPATVQGGPFPLDRRRILTGA